MECTIIICATSMLFSNKKWMMGMKVSILKLFGWKESMGDGNEEREWKWKFICFCSYSQGGGGNENFIVISPVLICFFYSFIYFYKTSVRHFISNEFDFISSWIIATSWRNLARTVASRDSVSAFLLHHRIQKVLHARWLSFLFFSPFVFGLSKKITH